MKNIVVIGSKDHGAKNDPMVIAQSLKYPGANVALVYWEDIFFDIQTGKVSVWFNKTCLDDMSIDLVIALGWYKNGSKSIYRDVAYSFAKYLQSRTINFWNSEMAMQRSTSKLSCMVELALQNIPVPTTQFAFSDKHILSRKLPFIAKAPSASRGRDNYLIEAEDQRKKLLESESGFLVQDFLPNDHDLRVICFGGEPALILKRSRGSVTTHLNNTSQGGNAEWLSLDALDSEVLTKCQLICSVMKRELAGIDLIPDASSPFGYSCLEVNAIPQLTSGSDVALKMSMMKKIIEEKL